MPEPPSTSIITHYLLENPWPLAIILLAIAAFMAWTGFREGLPQRQKIAGMLAAAAVAGLTIGFLVVTSGEQARTVTNNLVQSVVGNDLVATDKLLAGQALLRFAKSTNPGIGKDEIMDDLGRFGRTFKIDSNSITSMKSYSESSTNGVVHLACLTYVGGYPSLSQWVVKVQRQSDDTWKVVEITFVSLNNQPPNGVPF